MRQQSSFQPRFVLLTALFIGIFSSPLISLAADTDYNTRSSPGSSSSVGSDTSTSGNTSSTTGDPGATGGTTTDDSNRSGGAGTYVKDSYITAKVKAALARDKDITARNIKVETNDQGVVTLSGTAKTQAEVDKAVADAKSVDGVTNVVSNIQMR